MTPAIVKFIRKNKGSLSLEQLLLLAGGIVVAQLTLPPLFLTLGTYLKNFSVSDEQPQP